MLKESQVLWACGHLPMEKGMSMISMLLIDSTSALLLSTSTSTMILQLEPDVLLADIHDKLASQRTLAASHLSYGQMMVQVTPRDVSVWSDVTTGTLVANWEVGVESEIVAGQICGQMVLIAKRGGEVVLLSATDTGLGTVL